MVLNETPDGASDKTINSSFTASVHPYSISVIGAPMIAISSFVQSPMSVDSFDYPWARNNSSTTSPPEKVDPVAWEIW